MYPFKVGFIGLGNMSQAIIRGLVQSNFLQGKQIFGSNRSAGKTQKMVDEYKIVGCSTNEEVIEKSDIVILAMKPQDLPNALEAVASVFVPNQVVISIAAGITLNKLQKILPSCRVARVMPNTPTIIREGVLGFVLNEEDQALQTLVEDLFTPVGKVIQVEDEEQLEAITISASGGIGFVLELMTYWQDWVEARGIDPDIARMMTVHTFLGASKLAQSEAQMGFEDLISKVASKKGVTQAGLESMRELEIERLLRISFEKAALRDQQLGGD